MKDKKQWKRIAGYCLRYIGIPVLLELIIESLNRKSVVSGFLYMFDKPSLFLFNTLIIMLTVSVALFFKREIFVFTLISAVWLIFGIVNFVILSFRVTPFSAVDITLLESAISVSGHYLNARNIAMIVVAVVLVLGCLVYLFQKAPRHKRTTQKKLLISAVSVMLVAFAIFFLRFQSHSVQALETDYTNISEAYENYGFVYCFTNSIIDTGIGKPADYSEERVKQVLGRLDTSTKSSGERPNIIFIQLESFFDVSTLRNLKLSKDAIPNFHKLQKEYSSGLLTVPTVGAGTVNTEFEVLTGISQKDFGASEYPYKTILRDTTSESICYDLKNLGYTSHCVHNNEGTFYGRNKVFKNLGFDTFTSMEFMNGLEDNPNGWKKDSILTREILDTLDSTKGPDFTLGITVQSHGKYQGFETPDNAPVKVLKAPEDMEEAYLYYVNQLYEVDQMIGELVDALEKRNEKTILVLYGDHLPSLDIKKEDLIDSNLYQTQYVVWDNLGLAGMKQNLASYQLYSEVLERIGICEGNITKYHQNAYWRTKSYYEDLKVLEYDMLYGENYAYQGKKPFEPSDLVMGTKSVKITDVCRNERGFMLTGENLTPYAHVLYDGSELSAEWIDSSHIQILDEIEYEPEEEPEASPEPSPAASPEATADKKEEQKEDIPNAFLVQIRTDGGTTLGESEVLFWKDTSLSKEVPDAEPKE
ncbi:MAG: sulfatase-like hydrolase/transferase [Lachnospiraceae bacterium]|jgi:phosphoglycerol transferase MdoB-like AlkP superfamily enzyme|nr:sulfatase-like hydrolase/transferase [Lachnospiraceae bacterium]